MPTRSAAARRARERLERRDAILDAAERVFGEKGAANATMDDFAEAAQLSKGALYLYFKSKDDLFFALTHRPLDSVLARFESLLSGRDLNGLTLLRSMIEAHAEAVHAHAPQFRLAMSSMCGGFSPDLSVPSFGSYSERLRQLRGSYVTAIERGIADGSVRADVDPRRAAAGIWAGTFGATFLRINAARLAARLPDQDRADLDRLVSITAELLLSGLANGVSKAPTADMKAGGRR